MCQKGSVSKEKCSSLRLSPLLFFASPRVLLQSFDSLLSLHHSQSKNSRNRSPLTFWSIDPTSCAHPLLVEHALERLSWVRRKRGKLKSIQKKRDFCSVASTWRKQNIHLGFGRLSGRVPLIFGLAKKLDFNGSYWFIRSSHLIWFSSSSPINRTINVSDGFSSAVMVSTNAASASASETMDECCNPQKESNWSGCFQK